MKIKILALCIAFTLGGSFSAEAAASDTQAPVILNRQVVVEAPVVLLSDIFLGLDPASPFADTPVAKAPAPGRTVELDPRWLGALAQAYAIDWQPRSMLDTATVERAAQVIEAPRIEAALRAALVERGVAGDLRLDLDRANPRLVLPSQAPDTLAITQLSHDARSGRFVAQMIAGGHGEEGQRITLTGVAREITEIPVLARRLERGEIISPDDIDWRSVPADEIGRNVVVDPEEMIGMTSRRSIVPGQPLRVDDLRAPVVVEKNSLITIELVTERMRLSVQGRALENGARDQAIRVMNTQSNKVVTATVRGPAKVEVATAALTAGLQ
jgi:flagella basal body P-ring formation protein FlgA